MNRGCRCINCITPPFILKKLLESRDEETREAALRTLLATSRLRGERSVRSFAGFASAPTEGRRTIFDCHNGTFLEQASIARTERGDESADVSVNRAFEGMGKTREFYREVFGRNSIDDRGMRLDGYVHRGVLYNNAFWDGKEMVFGDGDQRIFTDFTGSLDVIAHEITHGVTDFAAGLIYHNQPGALNESISDVFGSLVKQWSNKQTAEEADWLIGADIFTPETGADALRSLKAPGTAYDNDLLGKDPQPDHMDRYVELQDTEEEDNGGVHINSGIPNKAFFLVATGIGGFAWEAPGKIWYESLKASSPDTQFADFAATTVAKAGQVFGAGSQQQQAVFDAWAQVGISLAGGEPAVASTGGSEEIASLSAQIAALAAQVHTLSEAVNGMRRK